MFLVVLSFEGEAERERLSQGKLKGFKIGLGTKAKFSTRQSGFRISYLDQWDSVLNVFRVEHDESCFFPKALALLRYAAETEWPEPTDSRVRVETWITC